MELNKTSSTSSNKRNLKRVNRLSDNSEDAAFDNAGFEEDGRERLQSVDKEQALFHVEETYPQHDKKNNANDALPFTQRHESPLNVTRNNTKSQKKSTVSSQNVPEQESIELKARNENSTQENRKVLASLNNDTSLNNKNTLSKDDDLTDSKTTKSSKMTFNVNLKRFEASTTISSDKGHAKGDGDKLKLTRQTLTEDLTTNRVGSSGLYASVVAASKFSRTSSARYPSSRKRPTRLLRDLSFSDADDSDTKDYGSLKKMNLPRRLEKGPLNMDTLSIMESLIHELIARGKIYQLAVLDLEDSEVLASVPSGILSKTEAMGMTKSIICQSPLFRLQIGNVDFGCFKHRHDAVQGRTDDLVLVMQMTDTCVVAGFARDDAPGSCNSEVHEFAKVLEGAGW